MLKNSIQPGSIDDLNEFLSHFVANDGDGDSNEEPTRRFHGDYFYDIRLPFRDLNREVIAPGTCKEIPLGGVGIRGDWDFWQVAYLPHRFSRLSCTEITACIWPDVENVDFLPDSGDYWWTAKSDDSLEVPGQPYEVWTTYHYGDGREPERIRIETFATAEEAGVYKEARPPHPAITYDTLKWEEGVRKAA